ncbi:MAG: sodium/proline symporter [Myxococcota bacterium]
MTLNQYTGTTAFVLYASILLAVGIWSRLHHKPSEQANFLLANRNLNFWIGAISANASDMSAWLFVGLPYVMYTQGGLELWTALGLLLFMFLSWHMVAPRLRQQTAKLGVNTLSSYFEARLNDSSGALRVVGTIMTLFFLTPYVAAGLMAVGRYCETLLYIPYHIGCIVGTILVVTYTTIGGLAAVAWVDFFQGLFLLGVIVVVPILAYCNIPADQTLWAAAQAKGVSLMLLSDTSSASIIAAASLFFGWGMGYFGQPHILDKFMALRDPDKISYSKWLSSTWQICALGSSAACGLVAIAFLQPPPANPELLFVDMVQRLFNPMIAAWMLCAVLAATLSSMDSQVLVLASAIAHDLAPRIYKRAALSSKQMLWISRAAIVVISFIALAIAWNEHQFIFDLIGFCWMGLGCSFGPVVLLCLHSRWLTQWGALAALCTGGLIGATWDLFNTPLSAPLPGFAAALIVAYCVSQLQRRWQSISSFLGNRRG